MSSPDHVFLVYFDGGYREFSYGSWEIQFNGLSKRVSRFIIERVPGRPHSSNTAEYDTLIEALKWLQSVKDKHLYDVRIFTDSMLVRNQISGRWRILKPHLRVAVDRVKFYLMDFRHWSIEWRRRNFNVARFGH